MTAADVVALDTEDTVNTLLAAVEAVLVLAEEMRHLHVVAVEV